ncbi:amidohydrolase [Epidermidibacterium keratini]|uniref:Amidohydrolase n=1 Tax=Epidermidibacterium keratini TaxID=1891644 RepID=A0A7L4YPY9_9ACTN|nr:M20 family metallopeptidase [Epidermidibacterium keratini]QHC00973.1 amidohydrolase [Epidermidibacterium keratini]
MNLREDASAIQDDLVQLRRTLHQIPEIGLDLPRTQETVMAELESLGLELHTGTKTTSITGVLRGGKQGSNPRTVLIRGDMDALPVDEETGLDFASTNGAMHACGHDLHTTALVGVARLLSAHRDQIAGDVVLMFQPGEEGFDGAGVMIEEGILDAAGHRVDAAFGMHVFSNMIASGQFVSRPGPMLSASHRLSVTVHGAGGHGSAPHRAKDPIITAAQMITALQTMVTRTFDIFDPVVITVGKISGGTKRNIIPDTASFEATVRRFSEASEQLLTEAVYRTLKGVAASYGVDVEIDFAAEYPTTVNAAEEVEFGANVIRELLGEERYEPLPQPISGSEDFSRVIAAVPGAFIGLGACPPDRDPETAPMNHSPRADFDPAVLGDAAAVYAALATDRLTLLAEKEATE